MRAYSTATAHQGRLQAHKVARQQSRPNGKYPASENQRGVVKAVNAGPPQTVDVYLDGAQQGENPANLAKGLKYRDGYLPQVNDVVWISRQKGKARTSRMVMGKAAGSATPSGIPLGGFDSAGRFVSGDMVLWGGTGIPGWDLGEDGHAYLRRDGGPGTFLYQRVDGVWEARA